MLNDPKPIVIGIAWVVECAEKRARVDEEKFKIDVDMINVAGGSGNNKVLPSHSSLNIHLLIDSIAPAVYASETLDPHFTRSRRRDAYTHVLGG